MKLAGAKAGAGAAVKTFAEALVVVRPNRATARAAGNVRMRVLIARYLTEWWSRG